VWRYHNESDWHEVIECAWRSDRSSPGAAFCRSIAIGEWRTDPNFARSPDPDQIQDWAKLLAKIEYVGKNGMPAKAGDVNFLKSGVWEFKHADRRLTYWDTDGEGHYAPKNKYQDIDERESAVPGGGYWWYPDMDAVLRLGCAWPKTEQKAPQHLVEEALDIREEDCTHDR
jgi:hypothetical protein